jgi:hypothetical protein
MDVREDRDADTPTRSGPTWTSTTARIGWVVLLAISLLGGLNHLLGVFAFAGSEDEQLAFTAFAVVNAYATAVLLHPYRRGLTWAWLVTWLEVAAFAVVLPLTGGGLGLGYLGVAAIAALAQAATLSHFRPQPTRQRPEDRVRARA